MVAPMLSTGWGFGCRVLASLPPAACSASVMGNASLCRPLLYVFGKLIKALVPALLHAREGSLNSRLGLRDDGVDGESGLAFVLGERDGGDILEQGVALLVLDGPYRHDQALWRDDLWKGALHRVNCAVGAAHVYEDSAPRPGVQLAYGVGEHPGAPPLRHLLGVGPCLEHQLSRGVDDACDDQVASVRGEGRGGSGGGSGGGGRLATLIRCCHVPAPVVEAFGGNPPDG